MIYVPHYNSYSSPELTARLQQLMGQSLLWVKEGDRVDICAIDLAYSDHSNQRNDQWSKTAFVQAYYTTTLATSTEQLCTFTGIRYYVLGQTYILYLKMDQEKIEKLEVQLATIPFSPFCFWWIHFTWLWFTLTSVQAGVWGYERWSYVMSMCLTFAHVSSDDYASSWTRSH